MALPTPWSAGYAGAVRLRSLSRPFLIGLVSLLLVAPQAVAGKPHGKDGREQREIDRTVAAIGEHFEELERCLDVEDTDVCFAEVLEAKGVPPQISGLAFLIGSIIKFKCHKSGCHRLDTFRACLEESLDPPQCTRMLDPRLERLAELLIVYRELRPYCAGTGEICPRPDAWPSAWPWPFQTHGWRGWR
jgi:hypothetical protein